MALLFQVLILRQLVDPANLAFLAGQADHAGIQVQHIDIVAGSPGRLDAANIARPHALAGVHAESRHQAGLADGIDHAAVNHRPAGNVVQLGQGGDMAGARQHIAPAHLAVLYPQRKDFTRCIGRDHGLARHRSVGRGQDAGGFGDALMFPQLAAIGFGQGIEMIVMGGDEDAPAIDHRCIDDGHAEVLAPDITAGLGIHAGQHAEA